MTEMTFVARKDAYDPASETISFGSTLNEVYVKAHTILENANRDHELFEIAQTDAAGVVMAYKGTVSWEPKR